MTASNHAITGALIAVAFKRPELAIPAAFVAHFAMDAIPHFGITSTADVLKKHATPLFLAILKADILAAAILLVVIPYLLHALVSWPVAAACMVACMSPDLVWGWRLYFERRDKKVRPRGLFSSFHKTIQWSETEFGTGIEAVWFLAVISLLVFSSA